MRLSRGSRLRRGYLLSGRRRLLNRSSGPHTQWRNLPVGPNAEDLAGLRTRDRHHELRLVEERRRIELLDQWSGLVRFSRYLDCLLVEVEILESIPSHGGLGSGTQLAMGLASACARLVG